MHSNLFTLFYLLSINITLAQSTNTKIDAFNHLKSKLTDEGIREPVHWKRSVSYDELNDSLTLITFYDMIDNKSDTFAKNKSIISIPICSINPDSIEFLLSKEMFIPEGMPCIKIHTLNNQETIVSIMWMSELGFENPFTLYYNECKIEISKENIKLNPNISKEIIQDLTNFILLCRSTK